MEERQGDSALNDVFVGKLESRKIGVAKQLYLTAKDRLFSELL